MSVTEDEHELACDDIAAYELTIKNIVELLPITGLTTQQIEYQAACVREVIDNMHGDRIRQLMQVRESYENQKLRAHERSVSTHYGYGSRF